MKLCLLLVHRMTQQMCFQLIVKEITVQILRIFYFSIRKYNCFYELWLYHNTHMNSWPTVKPLNYGRNISSSTVKWTLGLQRVTNHSPEFLGFLLYIWDNAMTLHESTMIPALCKLETKLSTISFINDLPTCFPTICSSRIGPLMNISLTSLYLQLPLYV